MADWSKTTADLLNTAYDLYTSEWLGRIDDTAKMFDGVGTNLPVGTKRWNASLKRWEKYNGTTWDPLETEYDINVTKFGGQLPSYYAKSGGDLTIPFSFKTATLPSNISTTLTMLHGDNMPNWTLSSRDMPIVVDTVADMEALIVDTANKSRYDNIVCLVRDNNRGGVFVYNSAEEVNNDQGINFNGWIRQFSGAVDVRWYGAKGDYDPVSKTGTDNTAAFQKVLDNFTDIVCKDGSYLVRELTKTYGETTVPTITFENAKLYYNGTGVMLTVTQLETQAYFDRLKIKGLKAVGTSSAVGCLRLIDCNAPLIEEPEIHDFSGAGAFAINMQNYAQWSENHTYMSPKISSCDIGWLIEGASITGGTGTESFARLRILNGFCASGTYWVKNLGGAYDGIIQLRGNMGTSCKAVLYNDSGMGGTVLDGIAVEQGDPTISYIYEHGPNAINAPAIHVLHYRDSELAGIYNGGEGEGLIEAPTEIKTLGIETTYPTKYISINNYDTDDTLANLDHIRPSMHVSGTNIGTDAYGSYNNLILAPGAGGKSVYIYTDRFGSDWAARVKIDSWGIDSYGYIMGATIRSKDQASATSLGTVVGKQPIYDSAGTLVGYMPIYDSIT